VARYRMKKVYINRAWIVLSCLLVCIALLCTGLIVRKRLQKEVEIPVSSNAAVDVFARRIVAVQNEELIGMNTYAREKFRAEVSGADALCIGDGVAAAYGEYDVYLFEKDGRITAHIKTDTPIAHVVCGAGILSVVTEDASGNILVSCYDPYANLIDQIDSGDLLQGDRLMSAGMRGNLLWLLTADTDGAQMLCHAYMFNVQKNAFLCRMDVYDQLIYDVFLDEKNVFLIGTNSILCYNHSGMRLWQMPCTDLTYVYGCEYRNSAALVFDYDEAQGGRVVYRTQTYALSHAPQTCEIAGDRLYLLQPSGLCAVNLHGETFAQETLLPCDYQDMIFVTNHRMLVLDGGRWTACMIP